MSAPVTGLFTEDTFDKSLIPTYLKKDAREVIEVAVMFGWKMHISGANSVTIISPCERKKYHFSASGRTSNSLTRIRKDVVKYADPDKIALADASLSMSKAGMSRLADAAIGALPHLGDTGTVVDHRAEEAAAAAEREERRAAARAAAEAARPKPPAVSVGNTVPTQRENERQIISRKPMVAKASRGRGYTSETTIERLWSDGSKDYACRYAGCDYTSTSRGSVPTHYAKTHSVGIADRPMLYRAEVPDARRYAPRQSRIDALAEVIADMLAVGHVEPQEVARTALTWVHEQSNAGTEHSEEAEPKTAEEVLVRIKNLLDGGETASKIGEMQNRLAEMEMGLLEAQERADQAEKRADQARSTLRAFMELAKDLDSEEESA